MSSPFVGEIRLFAFSRTPVGWQNCDGSLLSIASHQALYALLGTTYGGDGMTTFGLPDLRGQLPIHQGRAMHSTYTIGQSGGSESVTLTTAQLPAHTHLFQVSTATASAHAPGSGVLPGALSGDAMYAREVSGDGTHADPAAISAAGGSQPHDNLMPTLPVSFCISLTGIFPSRN